MLRFKVLLIDDEPGALEGMQLWIDWEELGFEICGTASNGVEGLRLMMELAPDLVVTDVNMPLMSGLEMIEAWQKDGNRNIRFAIISGYSEFEYARKAMRYGITHYLLKPVEAEEAADELRRVYAELLQEAEERQWSELASREEQAFLLRQLLDGRSDCDSVSQDRLNALSSGREAWNFVWFRPIPTATRKYGDLRPTGCLGSRRCFWLIWS